MIELFKKIRWINLLIIVFTMYAMRFAVVSPLLKLNGLELQLNDFYFVLLVLATVFLAAGGYIVNDYFDKKIDEINRPIKTKKELGDKEEETICCKKAMKFYNAFTITGVVLGSLVSLLIGQYMFSTIFFLVAGVLWFYSSTYKRIPFLGNIIVAVLSALVPLLVVVYEMPLIIEKYRTLFIENDTDVMIIMYFVGGFSAFAFFLTLIREIVKDIEDVLGDKAYGKNTIPVILGNSFATVLAGIFIVVTVYMLFYYQTNYSNEKLSFWYILLLIVSPLMYVVFRLIANTSKKGMHITSTIIKLVMFFGIAYSFIIYSSLVTQ